VRGGRGEHEQDGNEDDESADAGGKGRRNPPPRPLLARRRHFRKEIGGLEATSLNPNFRATCENYDRRRLMRAFRGGRDVSLEQGKKNGSACASAKEGCRREMLSTQRRSKKGRQRRWGDQKKRSQGGKKAPAFSTFSLLASAGSKKDVKVGCRRIKKARKTGPTSGGNAHQKERLGH